MAIRIRVLPMIIVAALGCSRTRSSDDRRATDAFAQLVLAAEQELRVKTQGHEGWGLGKFERWDLNQGERLLRFSNPDGTTAEAPAQIVGSYDTLSRTWLWAWANPSVDPALTGHARTVRAYGESHNISALKDAKWPATEEDAWKMVALAVKLNGAQGAYRGPAGAVYVFMTFGEVVIRKKKGPAD